MIDFPLLKTLLALAVMLVMTIGSVRPTVLSPFDLPSFWSIYAYLPHITSDEAFLTFLFLISGLILFLPPGMLSSYSTQDSRTPAFQGQVLCLKTLLLEDQDGLVLGGLCHPCLGWDGWTATASFSSFLLISYTAPFSGERSCGVCVGGTLGSQAVERMMPPLSDSSRLLLSIPPAFECWTRCSLGPGLWLTYFLNQMWQMLS